jgi:hypothetical protein
MCITSVHLGKSSAGQRKSEAAGKYFRDNDVDNGTVVHSNRNCSNFLHNQWYLPTSYEREQTDFPQSNVHKKSLSCLRLFFAAARFSHREEASILFRTN